VATDPTEANFLADVGEVRDAIIAQDWAKATRYLAAAGALVFALPDTSSARGISTSRGKQLLKDLADLIDKAKTEEAKGDHDGRFLKTRTAYDG
jgi:hypothetical protein